MRTIRFSKNPRLYKTLHQICRRLFFNRRHRGEFGYRAAHRQRFGDGYFVADAAYFRFIAQTRICILPADCRSVCRFNALVRFKIRPLLAALDNRFSSL
jgi:hypothetical protein